MKSKPIFFLAVTLFVCSLSVIAQNSPRAAVEAFYHYDRSHPQTFNRQNIDARKRWFSSELYNLFLSELKREAAYLKKNPTDKPFFGDGLPFQPLQESCDGKTTAKQRITVRQEFVRGNRAAATATFSDPKPCPAHSDVYTIGLTKTKSGWVIDDINYGEDTTLKQRLRRKEY
jgi:hypothetical protein